MPRSGAAVLAHDETEKAKSLKRGETTKSQKGKRIKKNEQRKNGEGTVLEWRTDLVVHQVEVVHVRVPCMHGAQNRRKHTSATNAGAKRRMTLFAPTNGNHSPMRPPALATSARNADSVSCAKSSCGQRRIVARGVRGNMASARGRHPSLNEQRAHPSNAPPDPAHPSARWGPCLQQQKKRGNAQASRTSNTRGH